MGIRESALNTITALTNSDFVRMVTAAGASRKASMQSIAQHIIESYAGSTLAGRQQSVKSALDELNSTVDKLLNRHITCTLAEGVSGNIFVIRTGNVCAIQSDLSINAGGISAGAEIATGLPASAYNDQYGILVGASGVAYRVTATTNGKLKAITDIPAAFYRISYVYVASINV